MLTKAATHLRPLIRLSHQNLPTDAFSSNPSLLHHLHNGNNASSTAVAQQATVNPAGPSSFAGASGGGRQGYQGPFRSLLHLQTNNPAQPMTTSNSASDEDEKRLHALRARRPSQSKRTTQTASKTPAKSPRTRIVQIEDKASVLEIEPSMTSNRRSSITYPSSLRVSGTKADLFTVGIGRSQRPASARVYSTHVIPRSSSSLLLPTVPASSTPKPQTRLATINRKRSQSTSAVPATKPAFDENAKPKADTKIDKAFYDALLVAIKAHKKDRIVDLVNRYRSTREPSAFEGVDTPAGPLTVTQSTPVSDIPVPPSYSLQTYNLCLAALLNIRASGDSIAPILEAYNEMLERDILPNSQTYAVVIRALCSREADIQEAVDRYEDDKKWREWEQSLTQGGPRSNKALLQEGQTKAALESYVQEGNFTSAIKLFRAAVGYQTKAFSFHTPVYIDLLKACAQRGEVETAVEVYAHAEKHKVGDPRSLLCFVIDAYGKKGLPEGINEVWQEYRTIAESGILGKDQEAAEGFSDKKGQETTRTRNMWLSAVKAYVLAGDAPKALELVEQQMAAYGPDVQVTEEMRTDPAYPPPATFGVLGNLIRAYVAVGQVDTAFEWWNKAIGSKDQLQPSSSPSIPIPVSSDLLASLLLEHKADEALIIAKEMTAKGKVTYDHVRIRRAVMLLTSNAIKARVAGDLAAEKQTLNQTVSLILQAGKISPLRLNGDAVNMLLKALFAAGRVNNIASVLDAVPPPTTSDPSYGPSLVHHLATIATLADISLPERLDVYAALARHGAPQPTEIQAHMLRHFKDARASVSTPKDLELTPYHWKRLTMLFTSIGRSGPDILDDFQGDLLAFVDDLALLAGSQSQGGVLSQWQSKDIVDDFAIVLHDQFGNERALTSLKSIFGLKRAEEALNRAAAPITSESANGEPAKFVMPASPRSATSSLLPETPLASPELASPPKLRLDAKLSSRVDQHLVQHAPITPFIAYTRVRDAIAKENTVPHADTLGRLMQSLSRIGEEAKVVELYDLAQLILSVAYPDPVQQARAWFSVEDHMLISCCHLGHLEQAGLHRARIIENGGVPTPDAYASMIASAKDTTDDASVARELFDESQRLGVRPHLYLYNTIISKLSKARKAELALDLFMHMKEAGLRPSSVTYGAVINACCRVGDAESAATLFNEMVNAPNFKPRVPPYNTMMQLYLYTRASRELVLHYYAAMQQARVPPSAHTYKLLLDAYGTLEPVDIPGMERVFQQLLADKTVKVQGTHWASLILAYGSATGNVDRAIEIFESIATHTSTRPGDKIDPVVWEALLNVFVTSGRVDDLTAWFEKMKQSGARATAYVYNALIAGYSAAGRIEQAREVFESMSDSVMGVAAPNNHPTLLTSSGQVKPSTTTDVPISVVFREPSTYEAMIRGNLQAGDRAAAESVYARMEERMYPLAVAMRARAILDEPTL